MIMNKLRSKKANKKFISEFKNIEFKSIEIIDEEVFVCKIDDKVYFYSIEYLLNKKFEFNSEINSIKEIDLDIDILFKIYDKQILESIIEDELNEFLRINNKIINEENKKEIYIELIEKSFVNIYKLFKFDCNMKMQYKLNTFITNHLNYLLDENKNIFKQKIGISSNAEEMLK